MEVTRTTGRPTPQERMEGSLWETTLLTGGPDAGWEVVLAEARSGTGIPPIPFPTDEVGYVLGGRVELTHLPVDYDIGVRPDEQGTTAVLGPGDAFSIDAGDRVMIDVLDDLTFLLVRRRLPVDPAGPPRGCCS